MVISKINQTKEGYLKHSLLSQTEIDSVPKLLFSKTFSYSDKQSDRILNVFESLYTQPILKPILDIIAVKILCDDDFAIIFGATLGSNSKGFYKSNNSEIMDRISKYSSVDQQQMLKFLEVLTSSNDDPLENVKTLEIQTVLEDYQLASTIAHELSHAVADIIFGNNLLGFSDYDQKNIYHNNLREFALKITQAFYPKLDSKIYPTVDGKQFINIIYNALTFKKPATESNTLPDKASISNTAHSIDNSLDNFLDTFLGISSTFYPSDKSKNVEIFARIFQAFEANKDNLLVKKFLTEFSSYIQKVVNPSIDKFMLNHVKEVQHLDIKPNHDGSYGIALSDYECKWNLDEELFFAVVNDNLTKAKELILMGANPSHLMLGNHKIINVMVVRNQIDLIKFVFDHCDKVDLATHDTKALTTLEFAKSLQNGTDEIIETYLKFTENNSTSINNELDITSINSDFQTTFYDSIDCEDAEYSSNALHSQIPYDETCYQQGLIA